MVLLVEIAIGFLCRRDGLDEGIQVRLQLRTRRLGEGVRGAFDRLVRVGPQTAFVPRTGRKTAGPAEVVVRPYSSHFRKVDGMVAVLLVSTGEAGALLRETLRKWTGMRG